MVKPTLVLAFVLIAATASAQSGFVQATYGREIKRFSGEGTTPGPYDATGNAIAIGGGAFVTPHWTIGAELDLGNSTTTTTTTSVVVLGRATDIHTSYSSRRRSASAIAGYHTSSHHGVTVGAYAGISFSAVRREVSSDADGIVSPGTSAGSIYDDRVTGAIVGLDIAIAVAPHFSVVPSLRAQGLALSGDLSGHSIRPGIGARITF